MDKKEKPFDIPAFLDYIRIEGTKDKQLHVAEYDTNSTLLLESTPIGIDFYLLAIKTNPDIQPPEGMSDAYAYFDSPDKILKWNYSSALAGYNILISSELLGKQAKAYNFMHYNNHEALYLMPDEKDTLLDLFRKAHTEYQKEAFSKDIIVSYAALILSYVQVFYNRQFESRRSIYNKVVTDFYEQLDTYFSIANERLLVLPSVTYFAEKANLTANYFGDVIKHFTGNSPQDHIQEYIIRLAKNRLRETNLTVSEIAYSLGFEYPTYFTRFFRKETGVTPTVFRNQL